MEAVSQTLVKESVDHLFRHHVGQMVSVLTRLFGLEKLDMIEDSLQDALICALQQWSFKGFPDNPRAWLIEVSKNRVIDRLRRDTKFQGTDEEIEAVLQDFRLENSVYFANELSEDQLQMIFTCCHPLLAPDSQVALTLKIVSGFSISEIARAFLAREETIAKMIVRAKQKLRKHKINMEMPLPDKIPKRLDSVLKVLYLVFNEGYAASGGEELIRKDLCFEAIRLAKFLTAHPLTATPKTQALTALFLFQAARLSSRRDYQGELLLLSEQNRQLWDKNMLRTALEHFRLSASGSEISDYHLEAEIASVYALAESFEATNWPRILDCYELLQNRRFSPIVELNRIIVLSKINGIEKGLEELNNFQQQHKLENYNLFHITKAEFLAASGRINEAVQAYEKAVLLTHNEPIRRFLQKKITVVSGQWSVVSENPVTDR